MPIRNPADIAAHAALTTGVHGVGARHVAGIEAAGAEAPLKIHTLTPSRMYLHTDWQTLDKWHEEYVGSGARNVWGILKLIEETGATINSEARIYTDSIAGMPMRNKGNMLFGKLQNWGIIPTNCTYLFGIWDDAVAKPPSLTAKHVGWKVINQRIWATNADGTTEKATDTGIDMDDTYTSKGLLTVCTETGAEIEYYVDDVLKATHTTNIPPYMNVYIYFSIKNTEAANKKCNLRTINVLS